MPTKYVVITGGVLSGLGKGVATASIARVLRNGKKIVTIKCDGYLNVDPGTMNPIEHGEVFVLDDGGEVDMDFGHYERYLGINCKSDWNLTSGKVFSKIIQQERKGDYLGKTIQIYPHVSDEIKMQWQRISRQEQAEICFIEIGGTVGDDENAWFIEAARQLRNDVGANNVAYVHLTYIPYLDNVGEQKTKAAQRDIALLREKGIIPNIVICRSKLPITMKLKEKLARMSDIEPKRIINGSDVECIYELPILFTKEGLAERLSEKLNIQPEKNLKEWKELVNKIKKPENQVSIAICGKYTELKDSYASIIEALTHAGAHLNTKIRLKWLESTDIEQGKSIFGDIDGIIVPGGFGSRGTEGKIKAIQHARENKIPYLGICYGLQLAVIEYARNVCKLEGAHTEEIDKETPHPVIVLLPEQHNVERKGGTMRLGGFQAKLKQGSKTRALYGKEEIRERHRHRYEVNPKYHNKLQENGLLISGTSPNGILAEFIELKDHPYFIATQAHNELTSRLEEPNPLFLGFIKAAKNKT